jgi:transcriptional regulator with XRE-family HTH domain
MENDLTTWLTQELQQRGWSHRELARRIKVSQPSISRVLAGERNATADFCVKVAQALGESPEKLLRLAEILPPLPFSDDPAIEEITELVKNMSPQNRQDVLKYVRFRYQEEQEDKQDQ